MAPPAWGRRAGFPPVLPLFVVLAVALLGFAALELTRDGGSTLAGHAEAVDGDTLKLGRARIRLVGLDAPEAEQTCSDASGRDWPCGLSAKAFVAGALHGGEIACAARGRDAYGRLLASCTIDGRDLGAEIVSEGWAVADLPYAPQEGAARLARRGIWSGTFVPPAEWRRTHGAAPGLWDWIRSWFQ